MGEIEDEKKGIRGEIKKWKAFLVLIFKLNYRFYFIIILKINFLVFFPYFSFFIPLISLHPLHSHHTTL